ncbi:MAG: ribonuclease III [Myxococcales bacterium]|nr:ribonuclease III [Myxococcales bacterium]|tara:strand:+ start:2713 stop:3480 length:768 start_codon:yes stop_codon:yes gene_type:complete
MKKIFSVPGMTTADEKRLDAVEERIGYKFGHRPYLLKALTHRSDARANSGSHDLGHYENFEFLGDAVLSLATAEALVRKDPGEDEGLLSQKRALYVSKDFLSEAAKKIELSLFIKVGNDVKTDDDGQLPDSILADVVESIIGATYLDSGFQSAQDVISTILGELPTEVRQTTQDAKTVLQERFQSSCTLTPAYEVLECVGPPHAPTFIVEARVAEQQLAVGRGPSKKKAEQKAAASALDRFAELSAAELRQKFAS